MGQIIEALYGIKGKKVNVYTDHKLFGTQHINMVFDPETGLGLGFKCKGQSIYVDMDDIVSCNVEDGKIVINGSMMSILIVVEN